MISIADGEGTAVYTGAPGCGYGYSYPYYGGYSYPYYGYQPYGQLPDHCFLLRRPHAPCILESITKGWEHKFLCRVWEKE